MHTQMQVTHTSLGDESLRISIADLLQAELNHEDPVIVVVGRVGDDGGKKSHDGKVFRIFAIRI